MSLAPVFWLISEKEVKSKDFQKAYQKKSEIFDIFRAFSRQSQYFRALPEVSDSTVTIYRWRGEHNERRGEVSRILTKRPIRRSCLWGDSDQRLSFVFRRGGKVERGMKKPIRFIDMAECNKFNASHCGGGYLY